MRPILRRVFFPILILAVALWFTLRSEGDPKTQREAVAALVRAALADEAQVGATNPLLLDMLRSNRPDPAGSLEIEIREGDGGPAPDGAATHTAMVRVDGAPFMGLRVRYDRDPERRAVIGMWLP